MSKNNFPIFKRYLSFSENQLIKILYILFALMTILVVVFEFNLRPLLKNKDLFSYEFRTNIELIYFLMGLGLVYIFFHKIMFFTYQFIYINDFSIVSIKKLKHDQMIRTLMWKDITHFFLCYCEFEKPELGFEGNRYYTFCYLVSDSDQIVFFMRTKKNKLTIPNRLLSLDTLKFYRSLGIEFKSKREFTNLITNIKQHLPNLVQIQDNATI